MLLFVCAYLGAEPLDSKFEKSQGKESVLPSPVTESVGETFLPFREVPPKGAFFLVVRKRIHFLTTDKMHPKFERTNYVRQNCRVIDFDRNCALIRKPPQCRPANI